MFVIVIYRLGRKNCTVKNENSMVFSELRYVNPYPRVPVVNKFITY